MSICKECGGVGVHHRIDCSHAPKPEPEAAPSEPVIVDPRVILPPPPDPFTLGQIVHYQWPSTRQRVACMVVSMDEGEIGLMVLNPHVRVTVDDVEEI